MSVDRPEIKITAHCKDPERGTMLFPKGLQRPKKKRISVTGKNGVSALLRVGSRSDTGKAAGVDGTTLEDLGGEGTMVKYKEVGVAYVIATDSGLRLQLAISVLTLVGTIIAAYGLLIQSSVPTADSFTRATSGAVFVIATVLAALKFFQELSQT